MLEVARWALDMVNFRSSQATSCSGGAARRRLGGSLVAASSGRVTGVNCGKAAKASGLKRRAMVPGRSGGPAAKKRRLDLKSPRGVVVESRALQRQRLQPDDDCWAFRSDKSCDPLTELQKLEHKIRYNICRKVDIEARLEKLQPKCAGEALSEAIIEGDAYFLRQLLESGCASANEEWEEHSPLFRAVRENHPQLVKLLLSMGADPERMFPYVNSLSSNNIVTPLMAGVMDGNLSSVEVLLRGGADPNTRNEINGSTALTILCGDDGPEINVMPLARALLKAGADPNLIANTDIGPTTALIDAAKYSDTHDLCKLLLDSGADPSIVLGGKTAMDAASDENARVFRLWRKSWEARAAECLVSSSPGPGPIPSAVVDTIIGFSRPVMRAAQLKYLFGSESDDGDDEESSDDMDTATSEDEEENI